MKIYGDTNSGNCLKVKWVCDRLKLPYSWVAVDTLKRETRTTEFLKLNYAGQVPTVEFDDGRTLAESNAIIRYLGKPSSDLDPDKIKRGYAALARMEHQLAATRFLVGGAVSLADVSLLAYTRLAHEGGFHLEGYASLRRWIGETEKSLGLAPVRP